MHSAVQVAVLELLMAPVFSSRTGLRNLYVVRALHSIVGKDAGLMSCQIFYALAHCRWGDYFMGIGLMDEVPRALRANVPINNK
jgi:hypothetical protein